MKFTIVKDSYGDVLLTVLDEKWDPSQGVPDTNVLLGPTGDIVLKGSVVGLSLYREQPASFLVPSFVELSNAENVTLGKFGSARSFTCSSSSDLADAISLYLQGSPLREAAESNARQFYTSVSALQQLAPTLQALPADESKLEDLSFRALVNLKPTQWAVLLSAFINDYTWSDELKADFTTIQQGEPVGVLKVQPSDYALLGKIRKDVLAKIKENASITSKVLEEKPQLSRLDVTLMSLQSEFGDYFLSSFLLKRTEHIVHETVHTEKAKNGLFGLW